MPFLIVLNKKSSVGGGRLKGYKLIKILQMIIRLMQDVGLGMDTPICQYINLDYLIALLKTEEYFVNRKKFFRDKREKSLPSRLVFSEFTFPNEQLSPVQVERSKKRQESVHRYEKVSLSLLTSCWTERVSENALMWDRDGEKHKACIKSTIGSFVSSIHETDFTIWCGKMIYEPLFPVLMSDDIIWYKQPYFSDEREIRFYFSKEMHCIIPDNDTSNHRRFRVDRKTLIQEIVLSPYIEKTTAQKLKECFEKKYKILTTISKIEVS